MGDWDKVEKYYLIVKFIWEIEFGKFIFEFVLVLGNFVIVYSYCGDFKWVIELLEKFVDLYVRCKGKKNLSYIEGLNNLVFVY